MELLPPQAADTDSEAASTDPFVGRECFDWQPLTAQPNDLTGAPTAVDWQGFGGDQTAPADSGSLADGGGAPGAPVAPDVSTAAPAAPAADSECLPYPTGDAVEAASGGSIGLDDVARSLLGGGIGDFQAAYVGLDRAASYPGGDTPAAAPLALDVTPLPPSLSGSANPAALPWAFPVLAGLDFSHGSTARAGPHDTGAGHAAAPDPAGPPAPADLPEINDPPAGVSGGAHTNAGIGSGGATAAQVQQALDETGLSVNGAGIKVGVLSDSFNDLGRAATDEADGALPPASRIQVLSDLASGGSDEGRAMMQIVHDIAPGASLAFYTAFNGEQDFANGILALAAAGCKVICDDVSYYDEPFFQNGVVAQAIQTVEAEGVSYVTAAGNDAANGYQAAWTPINGRFDGVDLRDAESFGGSLVQTVTINTEGSGFAVPLILEWDQAYGHVTSNLELLVFSQGRLLKTATIDSNGERGNPWLEFDFSQSGTYQIAIENQPGSPDPGLIKEITAGDGLPATISGANSGTVVGHAMVPGAITAGAVSAADTPAFGVNPALSESFSSSGAGTELLFDNNGNRLSSPTELGPVVVSGLDNISTTVSGGLGDFYGTSAASASLAGVAALLLQDDPGLTPTQVAQLMQGTALPMSNSAVSGAGLVQVDAAIAAAPAYVIRTDTNGLGSARLVESGGQYTLYSSSGPTPVLKYAGSPVVMGQFGNWAPIGAVPTAGGYDVAWKLAGASEYTVWAVDSLGNYVKSVFGAVPGNNLGLEVLELTFNQDLNGDARIGPPPTDFVFNSAIGGPARTLAHFNPTIDRIVLSATNFPGIGPIGQPLAAAEFHIGPQVPTAWQRIIYHPGFGFIDYHPTGSGSHEQIHFATVGTNLDLTHVDFLVVA
jgi:hypothetical protein